MTTSDTRRLAAPPEARDDDDPPVTTVMTSRIVGVTLDAGLATAVRLMAVSGVRHLPVFDGTRCRGLLLETDVVDHLVTGDPVEVTDLVSRATAPVAPLVRPAPAVSKAARRSDAADRMQRAAIDAVLVIERDRLVGIVTAGDLLRSLAGPAQDAAVDGKLRWTGGAVVVLPGRGRTGRRPVARGRGGPVVLAVAPWTGQDVVAVAFDEALPATVTDDGSTRGQTRDHLRVPPRRSRDRPPRHRPAAGVRGRHHRGR